MPAVDSTVSANYQVVSSNPFSNLGTRQLQLYKITGLTGVGTATTASNSLLAKALRGVASVGEMYYYNAPSADVLIVGVAVDTLTNSTDANSQELREAIDAATGGTSTVAAATFA